MLDCYRIIDIGDINMNIKTIGDAFKQRKFKSAIETYLPDKFIRSLCMRWNDPVTETPERVSAYIVGGYLMMDINVPIECDDELIMLMDVVWERRKDDIRIKQK